MNSAIGSGKTLEAAVEDALVRLGASPDKVTLKKLEDGGPGGLMGAQERPFRVRATWRPEFAPPPPPPAAPIDRSARESYPHSGEASRPRREREERGPRGPREDRPRGGERGERRERPGRFDRGDRPERSRRPSTPWEGEPLAVDAEFLARTKSEAEWLIKGLGLTANVEVSYDGEEVLVAVTSDEDEALLTGRRGDTRISIQQVLSRLVNPRRGPGAHVVVDVNGYLSGRKNELLSRAHELAREALASGEEQLTEPLSSDERRAVHRALTKDGTVETESYGDGALKRVAIRPSRVSG